MEYPKNGSVVIIDDKYAEVEGLIRVLSNQQVPTLYFNEDIEKMIPINGIRILFLDLDLKIGVQDNEAASIVSNVFAVLKKLIVENNGGYILVIWSTREREYGNIVASKLIEARDSGTKLLNEYPIEIIKINKNEVSTNKGGDLEFDIEAIAGKINSVIPENNILNLINHWENIVVSSSKKVINNFHNIANTDKDKKELLALFADSISQTDKLTATNIINPALAPISTLLFDQLSLYLDSKELSEIGNELVSLSKAGNRIDINKVSKINTFYHIDSNILNHSAPGTVFNYNEYMHTLSCSANNCNTKWSEGLVEKVFEKAIMPSKIFNNEFVQNLNAKPIAKILEDILKIYQKSDALTTLNKLTHEEDESSVAGDLYEGILKDSDKKKILKKFYLKVKQNIFLNDLKEKTIPIFLEFSPDCDYVQGKRKKLRLIFGLLIPYNFQDVCDGEKNKIINIVGDNIINIPIISFQNEIYQVVFDLHTVTGINEESFANMKAMFRFRKELLVDIQQKIASHIARPGFFNMNDYLK